MRFASIKKEGWDERKEGKNEEEKKSEIRNLAEKKSQKCINYVKKKWFFYLIPQYSHWSRTELNLTGISCSTIEAFETEALLHHLL